MYPKKANITVIGYPKILQPCQEVAEEYLNSANFLYYQYKAETKGVKYIASSPDHPLERVSKDFERVSHDIIIVGIVTAKEMAGIDKNKIIPFRAGAKPIIKAFMEAKKITDRTAFISPIEEKHDVHFYEKLTGLSIDIYYANTLEDYRTICLQARQEGHSVVVSGSYTFQIAREYGLKPVFLFSDHDIFHDAYSRALEAHRYNQSLEEKVSQLEIISEESQDVVIFVNNDHIVTFTNKVAEHKLGLNIQQIAGRPISKLFDFLENTGFSDKYNQEIIGLFKGEQILVQIHPVFVGGNTAGNILMVKTVKDIAAMDTRIRQKMRPKAFRARYTFRDILGEAPSIKTCIQQARKYALSDAPVLIYGATGTGKELFAQAIHNSSLRKRFPFVAINCATLPSDLMESELFGYVKGAFTGASAQGKQGLVDQAHLGTLFLDEVDSMSFPLQAKLLRLLQEKEFIRVGGNEIIPVDIRIIAACNRKPDNDPDRSQLRQDLFYRLSILYLQLPVLTERAPDVPMLFEHFLSSHAPELTHCAFPLPREAETLLIHLPFHGNLRELQGIAARFACLCDPKRLPNDGYLMEMLRVCCDPVQAKDTSLKMPAALSWASGTLADAMGTAERAFLEQARNRCNGSIQSMAAELGIARTTLWRKLKAHGLN